MLKQEFFSSKNKSTRVLINLTSYYSFGWTKNCIKQIRLYIPNVPILVIDNNPSPEDDEKRRSSFSNYLYNSRAEPVQNNKMFLFESERRWLHSLEMVKIIQTPSRLFHGDAINMAMKYAYANYFDILVHVEPDCIISGNRWYKNLLGAINDGAYMSSGAVMPDRSLHPCPSAWSIANTHHYDFMHMLKKMDYCDPQYPFLVDMAKTYAFEMTFWDTAKKAWYECAKKNKAQYVELTDFRHLWAKSSSIFNLHPML
jgi:GT2 family glycosyltransferase